MHVITAKYDNLFNISFPYSAGKAPVKKSKFEITFEVIAE